MSYDEHTNESQVSTPPWLPPNQWQGWHKVEYVSEGRGWPVYQTYDGIPTVFWYDETGTCTGYTKGVTPEEEVSPFNEKSLRSWTWESQSLLSPIGSDPVSREVKDTGRVGLNYQNFGDFKNEVNMRYVEGTNVFGNAWDYSSTGVPRTDNTNSESMGGAKTGDVVAKLKSRPVFFTNETMSYMEGLRLVEKAMRKNEKDLTKTEIEMISYKYGMNISTREEKDRETVLFLVAKGVIDWENVNEVSNLYRTFTVNDMLTLLYRVDNLDARKTMEFIQLTDGEADLARMGFSKGTLSIMKADESPAFKTEFIGTSYYERDVEDKYVEFEFDLGLSYLREPPEGNKWNDGVGDNFWFITSSHEDYNPLAPFTELRSQRIVGGILSIMVDRSEYEKLVAKGAPIFLNSRAGEDVPNIVGLGGLRAFEDGKRYRVTSTANFGNVDGIEGSVRLDYQLSEVPLTEYYGRIELSSKKSNVFLAREGEEETGGLETQVWRLKFREKDLPNYYVQESGIPGEEYVSLESVKNMPKPYKTVGMTWVDYKEGEFVVEVLQDTGSKTSDYVNEYIKKNIIYQFKSSSKLKKGEQVNFGARDLGEGVQEFGRVDPPETNPVVPEDEEQINVHTQTGSNGKTEKYLSASDLMGMNIGFIDDLILWNKETNNYAFLMPKENIAIVGTEVIKFNDSKVMYRMDKGVTFYNFEVIRGLLTLNNARDVCREDGNMVILDADEYPGTEWRVPYSGTKVSSINIGGVEYYNLSQMSNFSNYMLLRFDSDDDDVSTILVNWKMNVRPILRSMECTGETTIKDLFDIIYTDPQKNPNANLAMSRYWNLNKKVQNNLLNYILNTSDVDYGQSGYLVPHIMVFADGEDEQRRIRDELVEIVGLDDESFNYYFAEIGPQGHLSDEIGGLRTSSVGTPSTRAEALIKVEDLSDEEKNLAQEFFTIDVNGLKHYHSNIWYTAKMEDEEGYVARFTGGRTDNNPDFVYLNSGGLYGAEERLLSVNLDLLSQTPDKNMGLLYVKATENIGLDGARFHIKKIQKEKLSYVQATVRDLERFAGNGMKVIYYLTGSDGGIAVEDGLTGEDVDRWYVKTARSPKNDGVWELQITNKNKHDTDGTEEKTAKFGEHEVSMRFTPTLTDVGTNFVLVGEKANMLSVLSEFPKGFMYNMALSMIDYKAKLIPLKEVPDHARVNLFGNKSIKESSQTSGCVELKVADLWDAADKEASPEDLIKKYTAELGLTREVRVGTEAHPLSSYMRNLSVGEDSLVVTIEDHLLCYELEDSEGKVYSVVSTVRQKGTGYLSGLTWLDGVEFSTEKFRSFVRSWTEKVDFTAGYFDRLVSSFFSDVSEKEAASKLKIFWGFCIGFILLLIAWSWCLYLILTLGVLKAALEDVKEVFGFDLVKITTFGQLSLESKIGIVKLSVFSIAMIIIAGLIVFKM